MGFALWTLCSWRAVMTWRKTLSLRVTPDDDIMPGSCCVLSQQTNPYLEVLQKLIPTFSPSVLCRIALFWCSTVRAPTATFDLLLTYSPRHCLDIASARTSLCACSQWRRACATLLGYRHGLIYPPVQLTPCMLELAFIGVFSPTRWTYPKLFFWCLQLNSRFTGFDG
jgi:hypothetical protein